MKKVIAVYEKVDDVLALIIKYFCWQYIKTTNYRIVVTGCIFCS